MEKLTDLIKVYENTIKPDDCEQLIKLFEEHQFLQNVNGGEQQEHLHKDSRWTELDLTSVTPASFQQTFLRLMTEFKERYEHDCGIEPPLPPQTEMYGLRMKRYDLHRDQFVTHMDAYGPASNRFLVYLWYLNDVEQGGETEFVDLGIKVKPTQGTLVMFPPYWMYMHRAYPPISNPKYSINTFFMW